MHNSNAEQDEVMKVLEGTLSTKRGSRKIPAVLRFPDDLGTDEIPHVMQFKVFWRWERKDLTDAKRAKEEIEEKLQTAPSGDVFGLQLAGDDALAEIERGTGFTPMSELEGLQHRVELQTSDGRVGEAVADVAGNVVGAAVSVFTAMTIPLQMFGLLPQVAVGMVANAATNFVPVASALGAAAVNAAVEAAMNLPQYDQMVSIYLPMCTQINGEDSFSYDEASMDVLKGLLDVTGSPLDGVAQAVPALVDNYIPQIAQARQAMRGTAVNPRLEKMFKSKGFRSFAFSWELYPKTQKESEMIRDIIETFRYHASPSVAEAVIGTEDSSAEVMLRVPAEFSIRFLSTNPNPNIIGFVDNEFIPKVGRCALTSISVSRTPQGMFATFEDNAPIGYSFSLSFDEIVVILRQDIDKGF